jgi:glycosyltransferase involved in cell wall biosynthesis
MKRAIIFFGFQNPRVHKRGVENVIAAQAHVLNGYRKYYVFFDSKSSVARWGDIVSIGIKHNPARFLFLNMLVWVLLRRLKKRSYHVIFHSHNYLMSLFLWWRTDAFTVHDGLWYQKKTYGSRIAPFFYLVERIVYRRVGHVHCDSEFTYRNSLLKASGKAPTVIHCTTPFERLEEQGLQGQRHLAPVNRYMILSVRSIERRARIDLLIDAAERSQHENLPFIFVVAGKGPLLEHFRNEISTKRLKNIELLGYVSDLELVRLYAGCDAVLMTCEDGEGFGLPVIEGYLFGKPVIASNRCAVPEIVFSQDYLVENDALDILNRLMALVGSQICGESFTAYYRKRFSNRVYESNFSAFYGIVFQTP